MKLLYDCKTEEEKQKVRDHYLETIYFQTINQNKTLSQIQEALADIRRHMDYLAMDKTEKKYVNEDGSTNYDAIVSLCVKIEKGLDKNGRAEM